VRSFAPANIAGAQDDGLVRVPTRSQRQNRGGAVQLREAFCQDIALNF
jgi:hypothetical protein